LLDQLREPIGDPGARHDGRHGAVEVAQQRQLGQMVDQEVPIVVDPAEHEGAVVVRGRMGLQSTGELRGVVFCVFVVGVGAKQSLAGSQACGDRKQLSHLHPAIVEFEHEQFRLAGGQIGADQFADVARLAKPGRWQIDDHGRVLMAKDEAGLIHHGEAPREA